MEQGRDEKGRWKTGTSGNSNGRPPSGKAFSDLLRKEAEDIDPDTGFSNSEVIAKTLVRLAKEGNIVAIKRYADRLEGKPSQRIDQYIFQEENPILDALRDIIDGPESETDTIPKGE